MRIFQVDAFTAMRFAGNPATVILGADAEDETTLLQMAREFAHAEVVFVMAATSPDHDLTLRFFNARKEMPFVGHATIAAHTVLMALGGRSTGICRQCSGTGIIEVDAQIAVRAGGTDTVIEFRQGAAELDEPLGRPLSLQVAEALHLPATHLHPGLPVLVARKGSSRLLVPIADHRHLEDIAPSFDTLLSLGRELGAEGFFVFAVNHDNGKLSTESRMFCPALGIPEDPVSGNAHAMLGTYLWDLGQFNGKSTTFIGRQGYQMKRPGQVRARLEVASGSLKAVYIAGTAVIVSEGHVT